MEEYELRDQTKGCPDIDNLLEIYRTLKHSLSKAKNEKRNILLVLKKHYLHSLIYSELQYILLHFSDDTDSQFNKFIEDVLKNGIQNTEEISETSKLNNSNDIKMQINLSSQKGITLLRLHKIFKFPKFVDYELTADSICYTPNLLEFSIKCITERNKRFSIQARPLIIDSCSPIFGSLREAVSKFTTSVSIGFLKFSESQFCSIVKAAKHAKRLEFRGCIISSYSSLNFGEMSGCQIEALDLCGSELSYSCWRYGIAQYYDIFTSIGKCENLKNSLKCILPYASSDNKDAHAIELYIKKNFPNLQHIKITI